MEELTQLGLNVEREVDGSNGSRVIGVSDSHGNVAPPEGGTKQVLRVEHLGIWPSTFINDVWLLKGSPDLSDVWRDIGSFRRKTIPILFC